MGINYIVYIPLKVSIVLHFCLILLYINVSVCSAYYISAIISIVVSHSVATGKGDKSRKFVKNIKPNARDGGKRPQVLFFFVKDSIVSAVRSPRLVHCRNLVYLQCARTVEKMYHYVPGDVWCPFLCTGLRHRRRRHFPAVARRRVSLGN